jgi:hypothetical protein
MIKSEKSALHHAVDITYLFHCEVAASDAMGLFAVYPCMFFRPEENTLFSKRFDYAGFRKPLNVYIGNENDRTGAALPTNGRFEITGDFHFHRLRTMGAAGVNGYG